jgi:nucleotide-binding universal stress UspA family protein
MGDAQHSQGNLARPKAGVRRANASRMPACQHPISEHSADCYPGVAMCQKILVPLDGSVFAEQALPLAVRIASRAGAALLLVRVHVLYVFKDSFSAWVPGFDARADATWKAQEQAYLDGVAQRLTRANQVCVHTAVVHGLLPEGILAEAQARQADLIVMASHGHGRLHRFCFGSSVANEVARRAPVPVLLVPSHTAPATPTRESSSSHMLIPLDGSTVAEDVLRPALDLGRHLHLRCTLLNVVRPASKPSHAAAEEYLERVAQRLRAPSLAVATSVVSGRVSAAILEQARRQDVDLIALATHANGGLKRLLWGSVVDQIHRRSPLPVLIHRSPSSPRKVEGTNERPVTPRWSSPLPS